MALCGTTETKSPHGFCDSPTLPLLWDLPVSCRSTRARPSRSFSILELLSCDKAVRETACFDLSMIVTAVSLRCRVDVATLHRPRARACTMSVTSAHLTRCQCQRRIMLVQLELPRVCFKVAKWQEVRRTRASCGRAVHASKRGRDGLRHTSLTSSNDERT